MEVECRGLYSQLTSYGEHKPADVLVPASAVPDFTARALDVAITDPTCKSALDVNSHREPLRAARKRHDDKMATFQKALDAAGAAGLPFIKQPLVFETTGAMGTETQKWWKEMVALAHKHDKDRQGGVRSRRQMGLEHTWSANDWSSFWLQRLSIAHARHQAESITQLIGASLPTRYSHV